MIPERCSLVSASQVNQRCNRWANIRNDSSLWLQPHEYDISLTSESCDYAHEDDRGDDREDRYFVRPIGTNVENETRNICV
jgi:hypothetical protein